ncbi:hypothetical protein NX059_010292 [Plenodomus lindquistii]|nr:hypothetical protein NX059_010292 [Plenodomus lindquistii]
MASGIICNESDTSSLLSDNDAASITSSIDGSNFPGLQARIAQRIARRSTGRAMRRSHLLNSKARSGQPFYVERHKGNWMWVADDRGQRKIFDACGGAAVSCIGHDDPRVLADAVALSQSLDCVAPAHFDTYVVEAFGDWLSASTGYQLEGVMCFGSGSEGNEAAVKLIRQWHARGKPHPEPSRTKFIARHRSYHGATLGALDLSGFESRKDPFEGILSGITSWLSPCYPYRGLMENETEDQYVRRLANELEDEIQRLGPENVAGFFVEPVVGAALGCAPALPGYLAAMKEVCKRHGVLIVFDEVMCGMGRTGYLHAWQKEGVVPDIQIIGKGLTGGYAPLSAMLISPEISNAFDQGKISFNHGHTYQNFPLSCAIALAVQYIVEDDGLLANVREKGALLRKRLEDRLLKLPNIGDIRGDGLFIGVGSCLVLMQHTNPRRLSLSPTN